MRSSIRKACCLAAGVVLLLPMGATAQSIVMTDTDIFVRNAGATVIILDGTTADAVFGGGNQDGDIILRDTDGTTTTISLDGGFGLIQLGSPNEDGDLRLWDNSPDNDLSINLDGASGNAQQQLAGNGFVKGWAKINANGSIAACYNCNIDTAQTRRTFEGFYEVDFTPIGTDISSRVVLCSNGHVSTTLGPFASSIYCVQTPGDASSVNVDVENEDGTNTDETFTVVVF